MRIVLVVMAAVIAVSGSLEAEELQLPPEVTPALRAACEADARRLCIREDSTISSVRQCMLDNFSRLANKCRAEIVLAGLAR